MPHIQTTPRKDSKRGASVARRLIASSTIHPSILNSTIFVPGLAGEVGTVKELRAGRAFIVNGLKIEKGDLTILVQSKSAPGRWFVRHIQSGQWSTRDAAVIAKCSAAALAR